MQSRREFLGSTALAATAASLAGAPANAEDKISLAAWSLNESFFKAHRWTNLELPKICREQFEITGLEFVNQFFENPRLGYLQRLKKQGEDNGVAFVRIMVDGEGSTASPDKAERMQAAVAHRKWIDIAHFLGCKDIRCNAYGGPKDWKQDKDFPKRAAETFHNILDYAKGSGVEICIENHGGASSDPDMLVALIKEVNDPRFGTLPDFGNINEGDDRYEVVRKLVPYAKGISVKAAWQQDGTNPWDMDKLMKICQDAGFHGWWGVESSYGRRRGGPETPPDQLWENELKGVRLTKAAIERAVFKKA